MRKIVLFLAIILTGCSSVIIHPGTMDKSAGKVFVNRGGYTMRHAIKHSLEQKGYDITVGKRRSSIKRIADEDGEFDSESIGLNSTIVDARYVVVVGENGRHFNPICIFSGLYWWRFYVSIADNVTGQEILSWTARGCSGNMMSKLDDYLDELEIKKND